MSQQTDDRHASDQQVHEPRPRSPIEPVQLGARDVFRFRCHKGIPCFNECCRNIDIMLTPYDVLRLKKRLGMRARELLDACTTDFAMDAHGMPGLKLATKEGSRECMFLTESGCAVYEDRPSACRYYALGLLAMRRMDAPTDEDSYFVVKEDHCLGHLEDAKQTVDDYRRSQGLEQYDDMNREWRRIVLKKRSAGPAIGQPTQRSLELFFLASYDLDGFRDFVACAGFQEVFALEQECRRHILADDEALLQFAFRFLKQALFGEITIPLRTDAAEQRRNRYRERLAATGREAAARRAAGQDDACEGLED